MDGSLYYASMLSYFIRMGPQGNFCYSDFNFLGVCIDRCLGLVVLSICEATVTEKVFSTNKTDTHRIALI